MKVGVVSDVHNNVDALSYALEALRGCEVILSLGDLVSQYRVTPEILQLSRDANILGILGNHEKSILAPCGYPMRSQLDQGALAFLEELPAGREIEVDGHLVKVAHGSLWDDETDISCTYVFEHDSTSMARLASAHADLVLIGHTHIASVARLNGTLVVNPGSCGEARDRARRLSFAELDFGAGEAVVYEIRRGTRPEPILRASF